MAGYDDTKTILAVRAMMAAHPDLTRRKAIMAVAGEGSLRRIEMKMSREEADTDERSEPPFLETVPHALVAPALGNRSGTTSILTGKALTIDGSGFWLRAPGRPDTKLSFCNPGAYIVAGHTIDVLVAGMTVIALENKDTGACAINLDVEFRLFAPSRAVACGIPLAVISSFIPVVAAYAGVRLDLVLAMVSPPVVFLLMTAIALYSDLKTWRNVGTYLWNGVRGRSIFKEVNGFRRSKGLPPLPYHGIAFPII